MERTTSATQPKHINIGVVGLGIIGRGIAGHLRRKGFSVFVWNRSPQPVPNFVGSPGELAGFCNYIQIFVSDDDALLQTVEQLSEKLTAHHVIFAHSTVAPDSMRAAADVVERRGAQFVEACFTGSKGAAEKGELVYYVGGTDDALRKGRRILEASSKEILHIGPVGQASAIKVATNMVTAGTIQAAAEALALVQAHGLPLEKFVEAMRVNASYSGTLAMKLPKMLERDFAPHFSVKHMLKDMQIASQIALSHYLDLGVTVAARDQLLEQMQWGHGDDDYSAVLRKYLHEPGTESGTEYPEEPQIQEPLEQSDAEESITASVGADTQNIEPQEAALVASPEPVLSFTGTMNATAPAATPLRRGFLKQLLSRFSSGEE
jgi:3-hydroxyisobutyrate dehydrogenase-like beta-hydroxyacid dehydrogenase